MTRVLADTGPLYAAADPSDRYHRRAQRELGRLSASGTVVMVPWPVVLEAYTLVMRHFGPAFAQGWLSDVIDGSRQINPTEDDYRQAARTVRAYPDQRITLFDAVLASVNARLRAPVWTYDHHFDIMRVQVWR